MIEELIFNGLINPNGSNRRSFEHFPRLQWPDVAAAFRLARGAHAPSRVLEGASPSNLI